jgi:hypothetical protein
LLDSLVMLRFPSASFRRLFGAHEEDIPIPWRDTDFAIGETQFGELTTGLLLGHRRSSAGAGFGRSHTHFSSVDKASSRLLQGSDTDFVD